MLIPAFSVELNNTIQNGLATIGKFDGTRPSLAAATNAGKVFVYSPHETNTSSGSQNAVRFLNINKTITALTSGAIDPTTMITGDRRPRDAVMVATETSLLCYDIERNQDIFFKEVPDGITAMIFGHVPDVSEPLCVVGGNCSIQGFDCAGEERFWTVTGDVVSALSFCDADGDGINELLVGSEDYEIRIYQKEEIIVECTEMHRVTHLAPLQLTVYGYGLANGTVGVYDRSKRLWRVKSKHRATAMGAFDLDGDDVPELVTGWSNGRLDVRNDRNGELVYRDSMAASVSSLMQCDFRVDGRQQIICCAENGEVRGYLPADSEATGNNGAGGSAGLMAAERNAEATSQLMDRRRELENELRALDKSLKRIESGEVGMAVIPPDARVTLSSSRNRKRGCIEILLTSSSGAVLHAAAAFALDGAVFEGESCLVFPAKASTSITLELRPKKNQASEVKLKVLVGARASSTQFHVHEDTYRLSKFGMFMPLEGGERPTGFVRFHPPKGLLAREVEDRWIRSAFDLGASGRDSPGASGRRSPSKSAFERGFISLRNGRPLWIECNDTTDGRLSVVVRTDDMGLAGDVVQDLCHALDVSELETECDFPDEFEELGKTLDAVTELNALRMRLTAEMADSTNEVKALIIRAEDARMLGDMAQMRSAFRELHGLNGELIREYEKRSTNHQTLLKTLKGVNQAIQKAARLRCGKAKANVVKACRKAVKKNNLQRLLSIIREGA